MIKDRTSIFNEALLAFTMGIPWVFNPIKLKWTEQDTDALYLFLIDNNILNVDANNEKFTTIPIDVSYVIGIEDAKTVTYVEFHKESYKVYAKKFPTYIINSKIHEAKEEQPTKYQPKL